MWFECEEEYQEYLNAEAEYEIQIQQEIDMIEAEMMKEVNFQQAFKALENGKTIQSLLSENKFKKIDNDYYISSIKDKEFKMLKLDEGMFTSGEIQCSWYILD